MRRIFLFLLTTVLLVSGACAEGILPPVSTAPPIVDVETISLDAVLGAISGGIGKEKTADGGLLYKYHDISPEAYQRFSVKLGEEGYTLDLGETREDGSVYAQVSSDAAQLTIEYQPESGYLTVTYPPHVFPRAKRYYEDFEPVHNGDVILLDRGITATFQGFEKVDSYSYYEIDTNWIPSKIYNTTKETGEEGQCFLITVNIDYERLDENDVFKVLRSPALMLGGDSVSFREGRMVDGTKFRYDNDKLNGVLSFTYVFGFMLTGEEMARLDELALSFTDWNKLVPYVYFPAEGQAE